MPSDSLLIEKPVYGGDALARSRAGQVVLVPFALPGELVQSVPGAAGEPGVTILQPSPQRIQPRCVHFGVCGGCHYQMATYDEQLRWKREILEETLERAGVPVPVPVKVLPSAEPWGYRNRVRFRLQHQDSGTTLGYNLRGSSEFFAVQMCPIAAPVLWRAAETFMRITAKANFWRGGIDATHSIEISCDDTGEKVQMHLLCGAPGPQRAKAIDDLAEALRAESLPLVSLRASRLHMASGRAVATLASWGAGGLVYKVQEETFWLEPGAFFQVNRFLLPTMVDTVCMGRSGRLAWDLFAGVGLFSCRLARHFDGVTAVEANPAAVQQLRRSLRRADDRAFAETTQDFLHRSVLQRERPDLVVLDPPRAGLGEDASRLLLRLAPQQIVYVSCDPTTLARDLRTLTAGPYRITAAQLLDMFPQTYHLETVIVLDHAGV